MCSGATDYAAVGHTWHLDGELCDQLVNFDVRYIDAEGNALAVGDVDDQATRPTRAPFWLPLGRR